MARIIKYRKDVKNHVDKRKYAELPDIRGII